MGFLRLGLLFTLGTIFVGCSVNPSSESHSGVSCPTIDTASESITPETMFDYVGQCGQVKQYENAAQWVVVLEVFSAFDIQRVDDISAHGATKQLKKKTLKQMGSDEQAALIDALRVVTETDSPYKSALCKKLFSLSHPNYHPEYMIKTGMASQLGNNNSPLKAGFDPQSAWEEVLSKSVRC